MDTATFSLPCSERWLIGSPRQRERRSFRNERLTRERLTQIIREHRFFHSPRGTRLRTPAELAKIARTQGMKVRALDIEFAAARALLIIGSPKHGDTAM